MQESKEIHLTPEESALIRRHLRFYQSLDREDSAPTSEAQEHFVAVCRGQAIPETDHEIAYTKYQCLSKLLSLLTARKRAILKLRAGLLPLNDDEVAMINASHRSNAAEVKHRTLEEVAAMIGVTRERIRQIEKSCLRRLKINWNTDKTKLIEA